MYIFIDSYNKLKTNIKIKIILNKGLNFLNYVKRNPFLYQKDKY